MFKLSSQQGSISSLLHSKFKRKKKTHYLWFLKFNLLINSLNLCDCCYFCVCVTVHVSWCICGQRTALEIVLCSTVDWG